MEASSNATIEIRHNAAAKRFEATVDRLLCRCDYRMHGNTMMLVHTEVPPQLEGRGFAFDAGACCVRSRQAKRHGCAAGVLVRRVHGHAAILRSNRCWRGSAGFCTHAVSAPKRRPAG